MEAAYLQNAVKLSIDATRLLFDCLPKSQETILHLLGTKLRKPPPCLPLQYEENQM